MAGHPLAEPLLAFALRLPGAWEDHPWGTNVAKVGTKVFVFFGVPQPEHPFGVRLKLPDSHETALSMPWATSSGYGLDRGHWVWLKPPEDAPLDMLTQWIVESYRAVAPKRLVAQLPEAASPS